MNIIKIPHDLEQEHFCNTPKNDIQYIKIYNNNESDYNNYEHIFIEHLIKNIPCIIKNVTSEWGGLKWIYNNKPNFEYLHERYGDALVPVADCGLRHYNAQKKEEQRFKQYLEYWQTYIRNNYSTLDPCLYLKDWHFTRDFPDEHIYTVPKLFSSDWLNEYYSAIEIKKGVKDDYRFVYMGPKGSWSVFGLDTDDRTPLHADVFSSFSWSVNLCGKKRWVLFPPGEERCFVDKLGNLAYDIESSLLQDSSQFENYNNLEMSFEVIQNAGEAIFVPSGWHHQVWNLEDTISINHNWVNGCNIDKMWSSIRDNLTKVKCEIVDCRDMDNWHEHCQTMLNAVYGLDYEQFCKFLLYIINVRVKHLSPYKSPLCVYGGWLLEKNHLRFDLLQAKKIFLELISDDDFIKLEYYLQSNLALYDSLQQAEKALIEY